MRSAIKLIIIGALFFSIALGRAFAEAGKNEPAGRIRAPVRIAVLNPDGGKETLGTFSTDRPQRYAVIKDLNTGKQILYGVGDHIGNRFRLVELTDNFLVLLTGSGRDRLALLIKGTADMGMEFVKAIETNTLEYRYNLLRPDKEEKWGNFEFVDDVTGGKDGRVILERDYRETKFDREDRIPEGPGHFAEEPGADLADSNIDEMFFGQLKTKYMGNDVWIVDGRSVEKKIVDNAGKALVEIVKTVQGFSFGKGGPKISFSCDSAEGVLDNTGFAVSNLSKKVAEKAGFQPGDVIKSINGKKVSSFESLIGLFFEVKRDNLTQVNVEIIRNQEPKILTYLVK